MKLSNRGKNAPASPIRKLEPFAQSALARDIKIFHLNIGQPDVPTANEFLQAARLEKGQVLAYSPSLGMFQLRQAMAQRYRSLGLSVDTDNVLMTTGGSEALLFTLMALCDPGDEIISPEPCYPNYQTFAIMAGAKIRPIPTTLETGFQLPTPDQFAKAITDKTRAILLCNPNNPTGAVYPKEDLSAVIELCKKHDLVLIADEVYREFVYQSSPTSVLTLPHAEEVTVMIDSFSKRFSACGARIGCLVTKIQPIMQAATKFAMSRLSPPTLGQLGSLAVLENPEAFIQPMIAEFNRRRDILSQALSKIPGVIFSPAQGAFYLMAKLPVDSAEQFCQWLLTTFSDNKETVMLAPGPGFYVSENCGTQEVRIAYVLAEKPLLRAVELLTKALSIYPGKQS